MLRLQNAASDFKIKLNSRTVLIVTAPIRLAAAAAAVVACGVVVVFTLLYS
jgi:hypothetical protein